ncbi:hypothetical protein IFM89_001283 [Coptis chinensis]|uniref:Uncharacterized protein n=1 Tax=Coptis chinensis TaxID=261450 RepID=A0A835H5N5_9MAGN|nr:hypothetical protein IFM89_001283 [Coptis chinensis]
MLPNTDDRLSIDNWWHWQLCTDNEKKPQWRDCFGFHLLMSGAISSSSLDSWVGEKCSWMEFLHFVLTKTLMVTINLSLFKGHAAMSFGHFALPRGLVRDHSEDVREVISNKIPLTTRRMLFAGSFVCLWSTSQGDPSVTIEEVTLPVYPSKGLFPYEDRIVKVFETNTYSVVNIFDVTLRPQFNVTGVVEISEGNGSGVVWDEQGHIVTNYHVVGNALSRNPKPGEVFARVNILASEGVQKNFEGTLIGADRDKVLAVLKRPETSNPEYHKCDQAQIQWKSFEQKQALGQTSRLPRACLEGFMLPNTDDRLSIDNWWHWQLCTDNEKKPQWRDCFGFHLLMTGVTVRQLAIWS